MLFFLKRAWYVVVDNWRVFAIIGAFLLLYLLIIGIYRGCKSAPKLDEAEIQKGEQAVKERNDAELRKILVESEAREAVIDANVANAQTEKVNAVYEAKKKWANANVSELQAEFERRKGQ